MVNKGFNSHRCVSLATVFALLVCIPYSEVTISVATAGQRKPERTLKKLSWANEPIVVKLVKTERGSIKLGEKFADDYDDWYKGLTLTIENKSSKAIAHIAMRLIFRRPRAKPVCLIVTRSDITG